MKSPFLDPGVNIIIDGQWGSTGKGKLAGWLASQQPPDLIISNFGPNAGHTFIDSEGGTHITRMLPSSAIAAPNARILFAPDAVVDLDRLRDEIEPHGGMERVVFSDTTCILNDSDINIESVLLSLEDIASTTKGTASARVRKIYRNRTAVASAIPGLVTVACTQYLQDALAEDMTILFETAQGYGLSLDSRFYPYVTSRNVSPAAAIAPCGLPISSMSRVWGSLRTYPIRVGNTDRGQSGGHYWDQEEVDFEQIGVKPETTTVTGRQRRIFSWSWAQFHEFARVCEPTDLFLNFANYINPQDEDVRTWAEVSTQCQSFVARVLRERPSTKRCLLGTGAGFESMVQV